MRTLALTVAVLLSLAVACDRTLAAGAFPAFFQRFSTPANNRWVNSARMADVNGDGRAELITGLWDQNTDEAFVQIRGDAQMWDPSPRTTIRVLAAANGYIPFAVAAADVNGDGIVDLLVPVEDSLVILPGISPGVFGEPIRLFVPDIGGVAAADFDGDGHMDLAVSLEVGFSVRILRGLGGFTFVPFGEYATHGYPQDVFTRDWNGDGKPDLLVGADTASTILLGDGAGGFTSLDVAAAYAAPAGDLNRDGHEDLITLNAAYLGNGDGTFQSPLPFPQMRAATTGDMDEDGKPDLVGISVSASTYISILRGRGDGTFEAATLHPYSQAGVHSVVTGDFDGDGHVDVAHAGDVGSDGIMYGLGNGSFPEPLPIALHSPARFLKSGEFGSHTGHDLLVVSKAANSLAILHATGLAKWSAPDSVALPGTPGAFGPEVADLNGDGLDDVVLGYSDQSYLSVWLTDANGHLGPRTDLPGAADGTIEVAVGDIDLDGHPDILYQPHSSTLPFAWYRGLGDGSFVASGTLPYQTIGNIEIMDLNGDGLPDLAWLNRSYGISYVIATAPGSFGPRVDLVPQGIPYQAFAIIAGRLDGDAIPDLALENGTMWLFHGNGDGTFGPASGVSQPAGIGTISFMADVDGDGRDEIITGTSVTKLKTDGTLDDVFSFGISAGLGSAGSVAMDVDGNGSLDLVGAVGNDLSLRVLLNRAGTQVLDVPRPGRVPQALALAPAKNPCGRTIGLRLTAPGREPVFIELLDIQGRRLREREARPGEGATIAVELGSTTGLPPGVYLVRARQGTAHATTRVSVLN